MKPINDSCLNLLEGSTIDWNDFVPVTYKCKTQNKTVYKVLVTCGHCKKARYVFAIKMGKDYTGLCQKCFGLTHHPPHHKSGTAQKHRDGYQYLRLWGRYVGININALGPELKALAEPMAQKKSTGEKIVMVHRLMMAHHIGRPLTKDETVHHIDGERDHNDISNLRLYTGKHGNGHDGYYQELQEALKEIERLKRLLETK